MAERLAAERHCAVGCCPLLPSCERWLLIGLLVGCRDELKPLSECVTQGLRQGVDISQDDVEGEGELFHIGADLWQFAWPFEYGHLDVQYGVLQHSTMVYLHIVCEDLENNKVKFFFTYP